MKYLRLDLKICEGCGALWLRTGIEAGVYCRLCSARLLQFPPSKGRHPGGRPRRGARPVGPARCRQGGAR